MFVLELKTALIAELTKLITGITTDIKNIEEKQISLESKLCNMERDIYYYSKHMQLKTISNEDNIVPLEKIEDVYQTALPITTYEEFKLFDQKIVGDT